MQIYNNKIVPIQDNNKIKQDYKQQPQQQNSFQQILSKKIDTDSKIMFSKHASMRLDNRDIKFSPEQMNRIENGVQKAKEKGINDSLVLVDNIALVVNVKNKMVITAIDNEQQKENIFTNIDGAVIV